MNNKYFRAEASNYILISNSKPINTFCVGHIKFNDLFIYNIYFLFDCIILEAPYTHFIYILFSPYDMPYLHFKKINLSFSSVIIKKHVFSSSTAKRWGYKIIFKGPFFVTFAGVSVLRQNTFITFLKIKPFEMISYICIIFSLSSKSKYIHIVQTPYYFAFYYILSSILNYLVTCEN